MKPISTQLFLGLFSLILAVGCGNEESPSGKNDAQEPTKKEGPKDEVVAFMYGVRYADACIWAALDDPAKLKDSMDSAKVIADALEVPEPEEPSKDKAIAMMDGESVVADLKAKKGDKIAAIFSLATHIKVALFGSIIGGDINSVLVEIETYAKAAEIPESVWKADLEAIKNSTKGGVDKLTEDIKNYLSK